MVNIYLGQICRDMMEGESKPAHINIQIPYRKFASMIRSTMIERETFMYWINTEVYPALKDVPEKKITIELTR